MHTIPLEGRAREHLSVRIDGREFAIDIWWQPHTSCWYATFWIDGEVVCTGQRINTATPLLRYSDRSAGEIMAVPVTTDARRRQPGRNSWGTDFELVHISFSDPLLIEP